LTIRYVNRIVRFSGQMLDLHVSRRQPKGKVARHEYDLSILRNEGSRQYRPIDVAIGGTIASFFFFFFFSSYTPKLDIIFVSVTSRFAFGLAYARCA